MLNPAQTKTITVDTGNMVTYEFTVRPVARNNQLWEMEDAAGNLVDDIVAQFKSRDGCGEGYGAASLVFTLEGDGWEWDWRAVGRKQIPGIQFCGRPSQRRCYSEFQSYIDEDNPKVLHVELDPKYKEDGSLRRYKYCWVARCNGKQFKSADPNVEIDPQ